MAALTFVILGDSHMVTAQQFRTLVDVAVRVISDAARDSHIDFTVGGLHASSPTIVLEPRSELDGLDVESQFRVIAARIEDGVRELEDDGDLPEWMAEATARQLYQAADMFEDGPVEGLSFAANGRQYRMTRQTYRTLDRVLHETTETIGSVTGVLVTATLTHGPHVTVRDETHERGVQCFVEARTLQEAGGWIGERVLVSGVVKRDRLGRPIQIAKAKVEPAGERRPVTVAEMGGLFEGGPDSVEWLRSQRGE